MIAAIKTYAAVDRVGYHHFERAFLKARVAGADSVLQRLSCSEVLAHISAGTLLKEQFWWGNGSSAADARMQ